MRNSKDLKQMIEATEGEIEVLRQDIRYLEHESAQAQEDGDDDLVSDLSGDIDGLEEEISALEEDLELMGYELDIANEEEQS